MKKKNVTPVNVNISNIKDFKEPNLWIRGKSEYKKFNNIQLKKGTNTKTFLFGLLFSILLVIPFAILAYQYIDVYKWNGSSFTFFLSIAFVLIMLMNGLSNLFTIKFAKTYADDMINLQEIDEFSVMFYQILNPGFGIFVIILFLFFGASIL